MGSLFDGGTKKSTRKKEIPDWLKAGSKHAMGIANDLADRAYQGYDGEQVAGPTNNEQAGYLAANGIAGAYRPLLQQASQATNNADQSFAGADLSGYINPYTQGVLDPAADQLSHAFAAQQNQRDATAAARGAFGGLRAEIGDQVANKQYLDSVGQLYSQGLGQAWNQGANRWAADRAQQGQLGHQYAGLAQLASGLQTNTANTLIGAGQAERGINQAQDSADYRNFLEQRDWQKSNLQPLLSTLGIVPHGGTTTNTQQNKAGLGNAISGIAGLGMTAAGMMVGGPVGAGIGSSLAGGLTGGAGGSSQLLGTGMGSGYNDNLSFGDR